MRTCLTILPLVCSMTSRATTKSCVCKPCILASPWLTRPKNSSMGRTIYPLQPYSARLLLRLCVYFYRRFTGIEFAVVHAQPPSLFIIHKRERLSPDEGTWLIFSTHAALPPTDGCVYSSTPFGCVFYHEQPDISEPGRLYPRIQSSSA